MQTRTVKWLNVFDTLPSLAAPKHAELRDKLDRFLSTDPEQVDDVLAWWFEHCAMFPHLSRMALDYLTIPGMCFSLTKVISELIKSILQPPPSPLNMSLAVGDSCCHMSEIAYLLKLPVHFCALVSGAVSGW